MKEVLEVALRHGPNKINQEQSPVSTSKVRRLASAAGRQATSDGDSATNSTEGENDHWTASLQFTDPTCDELQWKSNTLACIKDAPKAGKKKSQALAQRRPAQVAAALPSFVAEVNALYNTLEQPDNGQHLPDIAKVRYIFLAV